MSAVKKEKTIGGAQNPSGGLKANTPMLNGSTVPPKMAIQGTMFPARQGVATMGRTTTGVTLQTAGTTAAPGSNHCSL